MPSVRVIYKGDIQQDLILMFMVHFRKVSYFMAVVQQSYFYNSGFSRLLKNLYLT